MTTPPESTPPGPTPPESAQPLEPISPAAPEAIQDAPLPPPPPPPTSTSSGAGASGGARFCTACGAPLGAGAEFCSSCGTPVGATLDYRAATIPRGSMDLAGTSYALAGFWRRFAAMFIDGIVALLVAAPILGIAFFMVLAIMRPVIDSDGAVDPDWDALASLIRTGIVWGGVWSVIGVVISLAFEAYGWTPGKAAVGVRVLREDGRRPGWVHGAARYIGKTISSIPFLLGYFWMIWDPRKQAWHDKFASTYVVKVPYGGIREPAGPAPLALSTGAKVWAGLAALYIVYNAFNYYDLVSRAPRDGATLERFFQDLQDQNPPRPGQRFGPRSFDIQRPPAPRES